MGRIRSFLNRIKLPAMIIGLALTVSFFVLWKTVVVTILPGESGVFYSRLMGGTDMNKVYGEGVHLKFPWDKMYIYDVRVQEIRQNLDVLSSDGLTIKVMVSCRFQAMKEFLPKLHVEIGPNYLDKIILPSLTSAVRQAIGKYRPMELYSTARQELQDQMLVDALQEVSRVPIILHNVIVKRIELPEMINQAIEKKLEAEQEYLRYQYILQTTIEEAKRKTIEAQGISNYQKLVNKNMTNDFLRFEGIKATKDLASSNNAKIVVVGGGKDGLPIILNSGEDNTSNTTKSILKTKQKAEEAKEAENLGNLDEIVSEQNNLIEKLKYWDKILLNPMMKGK